MQKYFGTWRRRPRTSALARRFGCLLGCSADPRRLYAIIASTRRGTRADRPRGKLVVIRRRGFIQLVASGMLTSAAGCDSADEPTSRPTDEPDPLAEVRAAAGRTASVSTRTTMSVPGLEVDGEVDPVGRTLALTISTVLDGETTKQRVRVLGDDAYLMLGKTYMPTIDATKYIPFAASSFASASVVHLADPFDPAGLKGLAPALVDARRSAADQYAGTLDLASAPTGTSRGLLPADADQVRAAGDVLRAIPYEATVDGQGYLTSMTVKVPAFGSVPAYVSTARFSAFGRPVRVARPAAEEMTDVPENIRRLLTR
ncbi:hypothetical protein M2302_005850 [Micromonospora sp. A200]|uniref:hypothetical protein n=1 Tax=Micromonospora sp. A200 TaxID=2940568 RepID=UPI002473038D|nr:hypothetical protein [Micromonospora sp. A200]MDH6465648.1 hypothetical protein [Micromonospora sp. A200]